MTINIWDGPSGDYVEDMPRHDDFLRDRKSLDLGTFHRCAGSWRGGRCTSPVIDTYVCPLCKAAAINWSKNRD